MNTDEDFDDVNLEQRFNTNVVAPRKVQDHFVGSKPPNLLRNTSFGGMFGDHSTADKMSYLTLNTPTPVKIDKIITKDQESNFSEEPMDVNSVVQNIHY